MNTENYSYDENNYVEHTETAFETFPENPVEQPVNNTSGKHEKKKGRGKTAAGVIALALGCSLVGGAVGAGGVTLYNNVNGNVSQNATTGNMATIFEGASKEGLLSVAYKDTSEKMSAAEIYAANVNSTVGITTSVTATNFFGYRTTTPASGSGFILTENGYIVTNYHVVEDGSDIKVTTYDNTVYDAKLIGYDESNDIAVLKVDAENLTPVVLGDSDQMNVGDDVVAIGNPLGELTFSLTSGSVSALNRQITINNVAMNLIQTDCAINSGNSGGALFNAYGEVIGITNAKYSTKSSSSTASIDNIGFAIPINSVKDIVTEIIEDGSISKPYIGVNVYELGSEYQRFGLSGVVVSKVEENSPAEKAGLEENDIIIKVNGESISSLKELKSGLATGKDGETVTLTVYRMGETMDIDVKLSYKKQSALPEKESAEQTEQGQFPFSDFGFR